MAGARSVINRKPPEKVFEPKGLGKRSGSITQTEQALVTQFVLDQPREVTTTQVAALSKVLRRSKDAVKAMIETAREEFQSNAEFYTKSHKQSVERALAVTTKDGAHDPKALDVAARASQWALENLSAEGQRIVDKPSAGKGDMGPRIMVAIRMGGMNTPSATEVVEVPPSTPPSSTGESPTG